MSNARALTIETVTGQDLIPVLPDLARLRTIVFRTYPYLYDGDEEYERNYLQTYVESPGAGVIIARDNGVPVGASTCLPMQEEEENVAAPFVAHGIDPARVFYFGESVLLPEYRGSGVGVAFFEGREAHARAVSRCDYAAFCSVVRPADHPARPAGHVPLDAFWRKRGFTPYPDYRCRMRWKEVGQSEETEKELSFWLKSLSGVALP